MIPQSPKLSRHLSRVFGRGGGVSPLKGGGGAPFFLGGKGGGGGGFARSGGASSIIIPSPRGFETVEGGRGGLMRVCAGGFRGRGGRGGAE